MKNICVIGGGRWGENHIRTLFEMGNLGGIVEANPKRLRELLEQYPVKGFQDVEMALKENFDGFTIAAPAPLHYDIAKLLLEHGKSVLVEKPMTLSSETSLELVELAKAKGAQLMVGHVLLFHPAIVKIKELIDNGKIGELYYIYSNRLNLGTVRTEENVFWSFAPHDISVLNYFVGEVSQCIESKGAKFLQKNVYDYTMTQLTYPNNIHAHIFVSWLHPFKEHRMVVIGSRGMISFEIHRLKKRSNSTTNIEFEQGFRLRLKIRPRLFHMKKSNLLPRS